jgi:hypothetical protein
MTKKKKNFSCTFNIILYDLSDLQRLFREYLRRWPTSQNFISLCNGGDNVPLDQSMIVAFLTTAGI